MRKPLCDLGRVPQAPRVWKRLSRRWRRRRLELWVQARLRKVADGWYAVTNTRLRVGFALRYPAEVFKHLWYWQVYRGGRDYPWWNATYNIALEPCATLPVLSHAAARGEALSLAAGESTEVELLAIAFEGLTRVTSVDADGEVMSDE